MESKEKPTHDWNDNLETCLKCGDKDWRADEFCSEYMVNDKKYIVVAGKYEDYVYDGHLPFENYKYISEPMTYEQATAKYQEMKGYPFCRIELDRK